MNIDFDRSFKGIIKEIKLILKRCAEPARQLKNYSCFVTDEANCFIHAFFNFSDNTLEKIVKKHGYGALYTIWHIKNLKNKSAEQIGQELVKRVQKTGLQVEECDEYETMEKGQWRVAYYSSPTDYHFMRQEEDGTWSSKRGSLANVETFKKLPPKFESYKLKKYFKVTNLYIYKEEEKE